MDHERAKELLSAIHSCQDSGCEKDCEAACEMLEADPELQAWYEKEMGRWSKFDEAVATKFDCCEASEDKKTDCKSRVCGGSGGTSRVFKFLVPLMAAAALFMIGFFAIGGGAGDEGGAGGEKGAAVQPFLVANTGAGFMALRDDMATFVAGKKLDLHHRSSNFDDLKAWLVSNGAPAGAIKACVVCKEGVGCAVLAWGGKDVSMVCFRDEALGGDGIVHLFVIDRSVLGEAKIETLVAQKSRRHGLATGGWANDDKVYLMVGDDPQVNIDSLL
jgi:hypothetical protein